MTSFVIAITLTILLFISPILLTTANADNVRDYKGKKAINGANYYIKPYMPGPNDGSITWAYNASSNQNCPLFVTQGYDTYTPATISTYLSSKYIPLNFTVFIDFQDNTTPCNNQLDWSYWLVSDSNIGTLYVVAGAPPSPNYSTFHIVDAGINQKNVYKFTYCDDADADVGAGCLDVGWLANSSDPYLVITGDPTEINPFYFVLARAF